MSLATAENFITQFDTGLRSFGIDIKTWVGSLDLVTVGVVTLFVAVGVLVFDLGTYLYAKYAGTSEAFQPLSRSLALGVAKVWQSDELGLNTYFDDTRGGRSLNTLTDVLDSLTKATLEWEEPSSARSRTL